MMRDNIELLLARGDKLDELEEKAGALATIEAVSQGRSPREAGGAVVKREVWAGGGDGGDGGRRGDSDAGDRRRRRVEFGSESA